MKFHKLTGRAEQPAKADKSAVCAINDSVGKIGIDQLDQASSERKRRVKQAKQAKAFPGQRDACRETQQVCPYYT
jgi:hypothetical protein